MIFPGGPAVTSYLFVDGAYLQQRISALGRDWFGCEPEVDHAKLASGFTKTFYYDALPAQNAGELDADYAVRLSEKEAFFNRLRSLNGWHVYEGVSKRPKGDRASQKEVDVLIAVDMLTHTYRKNMDKVTFIAGDQDFRPLVDAVVREGMFVELWFDPRSISRDLRHTADARRELDLFVIHNYFTDAFRAAHPLPSRSHSADEFKLPDAYELTEVGYRAGIPVARLWLAPDQVTRAISSSYPVANGIYYEQMCLTDVDMLKRAYSHLYGDMEWRRP